MEYRFGSYGVQMYGGNLVTEGVVADFPLVGSNVELSSKLCNLPSRNFGCRNHKGHEGKPLPVGVEGQVGLDGLIGKGKAVVFPHFYHCFDPLCPVCCMAWAKRLVNSALARFDVFKEVDEGVCEVHHVVVSVPEFDWDKSLSKMRRQAINFAEGVGVVGGWCIYHPKRYNAERKIWFFEPHFHIVGRVVGGRVDGLAVRDVHNLSGYVLKRLDERKSVRVTMLYQLSHAGVVGRGKTVNWFGDMVFKRGLNDDLKELMNANVRDEKLLHKGRLCPVCGEVMKHVCRVAKAGVFDYVRYEDCFVLDDVDCWVVVPDVFHPRKRKGKEDDYGDDYADFVARSA